MNRLGRLISAQSLALLFILQQCGLQCVLPAYSAQPVPDTNQQAPTAPLSEEQRIDIDPLPESDMDTGENKKGDSKIDQRIDMPEQTTPPSPSAKSTGTELAPHFSPTDANFVRRYLKDSDYIPVSEIKPGMEGYGLTVFQGTKIEKFDVKVIGVIRKALNGRDAILIRISGEKLGKNNVVRGMSGSPIYLDGRLCGALSYGFDFSREPIVGVTPVVDMLDALTFHDEITNRKNVSYLHKSNIIEAPASSLVMPNTVPVAGGTMRMTPLLAPVSLSGFSPRAQQFLKDKFEDVGLGIASGGTGALDPTLFAKMGQGNNTNGGLDPSKVAPGSAVAVMLTTGAFSSAATGTTTAIFGNKVVAFGHSFMEGGSISLPMATAYILEILPSLSVSFKLSSPLQIVGSIFADRPWSIGAELGRYATMVPLDITVLDESRGVKKDFRCKVVNHPQLTPDLITASIMSSLDSTYQSQTPFVVRADTKIAIKDHGVIKRVDRFPVNFSPHVTVRDSLLRSRPPGDPLAGYVGGIVDRLISNDYERAQVTSVAVDITIEDGRRVTKIDHVTLDKSIVAPGENVTLNCLMKPYNGKPYNKAIVFHIPRDVPDCDLALAACGGDELESVRRRMGVSQPSSESLNQIIARLRRKERGDTLCGELALPQQSIAWQGQIIKSPPAHWAKLFFSDRSTKTPSLVRSDESFRETGDNIVDGSHIIAVTVRRADKIQARAMPLPLAGTSATPSDGIYITEQARKALDAGRKADTSTTAAATATAVAAASAVADNTAKMPPLWSVASAFPHTRGIQLWRQDAEESFRGANLDGVQVDSWGRLYPGYKQIANIRPAAEEDQRIWAGDYLNGNFYYASGNKIFRWNGSAEAPQVVATGDGLIIPALVADSARGTLYYAPAPGNKVYALNLSDPSLKPQPQVVAQLNESTITTLAVTPSGSLYIGASGTGKLYKRSINAGIISTAGSAKPELVFDSGQAHITSLWFCKKENRLYVGTAEKGSVYSLAVDGPTAVKAEFDSGEHIVTGVVKDASGNLFVSTAGSGKLLRVKADGDSDEVALSEAFYRLYYDPHDDAVYAGDGEGDVTKVVLEKPPFTDQTHFLPVCHSEQEAVMALTGDGQGRLFCGTANIAELRCLEVSPSTSPSMQSLVHDANRVAEWSRLRLGNVFNQDQVKFDRFIKVETRGGATSQPDASWSPWMVAPPDPDGHNDGFVIKSAPSRFIQYKLTWQPQNFGGHEPSESKTGRDLLISRVDVTYLPANTAPSFSSVSLKTNEALAGKVNITVTGSDVDADNMQMAMALSADGGHSWLSVAGDIRSRATDKEKEKSRSAISKVKSSIKSGSRSESKSETKLDSKSDSKTESKPDPKNTESKSDNKSEVKPESKPEAKLAPVDKDRADKAKLQDSFGSAPMDDETAVDSKADTKADTKASGRADAKKEKEAAITSSVSLSSSAKNSENYSLTEKISYNFDSKKEKDGAYIVRLTLSDRPSNSTGAQSTAVFRAITIDNTDPIIDSVDLKKTTGDHYALRLTAHDATSAISDCVCKIEDGESFALSPPPSGGPLSDASRATFAGDILDSKGAKKLTIQVFDRAGNSVKKTVSLP